LSGKKRRKEGKIGLISMDEEKEKKKKGRERALERATPRFAVGHGEAGKKGKKEMRRLQKEKRSKKVF